MTDRETAPDREPGPGTAPGADAEPSHRPRRSLRHRLPVRLRHHWKLLAVCTAAGVALSLTAGSAMVRPYITSELTTQSVITQDISGEGDLFDDGVHTIEISYDETEYAEVIDDYQEDGEKNFLKADITIDGVLIEDVGLRLKGNSTLSSLRSDDEGGGMGEGMPEGRELPEGMEDQGGMGGMGMTQLSEDSPEELPWLISFDEYQEGRAFQGRTEITLRPAASGSDTALNEALALELTARSGQTTQQYTYTTLSVNGGEESARLVVDTPDTQWADSLGEGVLYKARAGGSLEYVGEDPTDYEESFHQINAEGSYDLQPVIDLVRFLDEADDEEFAREIDQYVDVESFATYLATQALLSNSDGMSGPGNNYYLWYDTSAEQFTVLSWDLNLSFSAMGGGGGPGRGGTPTDGEAPAQGEAPAEGEAPAQGEAPPSDGGMPDGQGMPQGPGGEGMPEMPEDGEMPEGMGGLSVGGSGVLEERLREDEDFVALYEQSYADLYEQLVASGDALSILEELTARAESVGDQGASELSTSLAAQLEELTAEAPEESTTMPGRPG